MSIQALLIPRWYVMSGQGWACLGKVRLVWARLGQYWDYIPVNRIWKTGNFQGKVWGEMATMIKCKRCWCCSGWWRTTSPFVFLLKCPEKVAFTIICARIGVIIHISLSHILQLRLRGMEVTWCIDGWRICDFMSLSTVFQSYQDYRQMIMKGCVK